MRKVFLFLGIVAWAASSIAQESGSLFTPYGLGMYRLRYEQIGKTIAGVDHSAGNYSNRVAYKFGVKAKINNEVSGQFEIGNDWFATEEVTSLPTGNYFKKRNPYTPWISLAFMRWDPGYLHIETGVLPIKGSALMDLVGFSIYFDRVFGLAAAAPATFGAAHLPWGVLTNFSMPGMRVGTPSFDLGGFKIGADLFTTVLEQRTEKAVVDFKMNSSAIMLIVDVPMSAGGFTATPQLTTVINRNYSSVLEATDHEIGFGADAGYKFSDIVSVRAGFGMDMLSNENTFNAAEIIYKPSTVPSSFTQTGEPVYDTVPKTPPRYDRRGMNITSGVSVKMGPGKLDLDFNYSTDDNLEASTPVAASYMFVDVKYGWGVNKNFIVMPRVRVYSSTYENDDNALVIWPELMLFGTF